MDKGFAKADLQELSYKWKIGALSEQEQERLDAWENSLEDDILTLPATLESAPDLIRERITSNVLSRIRDDRKKHTLRLWYKRAIAASFIAALFSIAFLLYTNFPESETDKSLARALISPGRSGATLTLADGRKVVLGNIKNGELASESGITITKSANGQLLYQIENKTSAENGSKHFNTLSTANGETYKVRLPDGSLVHLNSASSLTYNTMQPTDGKRIVSLKGEAYFEVAKDKKHPFIVQSNGQEVEVLGTHFNIKAYGDELITKTTLLEGLVKVNHSTYLKPGEQSVLKEDKIQVRNANVEDVIAWKNGRFAFTGNDFYSNMHMISRWYDVDIVYDYRPENLHISGGMSRFDNIDKVLEIIQETGDVKFKIEGRRIHVIK